MTATPLDGGMVAGEATDDGRGFTPRSRPLSDLLTPGVYPASTVPWI